MKLVLCDEAENKLNRVKALMCSLNMFPRIDIQPVDIDCQEFGKVQPSFITNAEITITYYADFKEVK